MIARTAWRRSAPRPTSALRIATVCAVLAVGTGCRGFVRAQTGGAYNLPDRKGHTGQLVAADAVIGLKNVKWPGTNKPLPFALHTSGDAILAPERKAFGWGTGIAFYGTPRPVSAYGIGGTSLHFDEINGRFSFGNVSPYGEIGVITSVPSRYEDGGDGLIVTLGVGAATYINYLAAKSDTIDGFMLVKLGVGWEKN